MNEREILARTLQAEAGNQGLNGMLAVGSVINNRASSGNFGQGIEGVIMKPGQFSAWNGVTGYAGGEQGQDMASMTPSEDAYTAADQIISGQYEDATGGAVNYYADNFSNPNWGLRGGGEWNRIGDHLFGTAAQAGYEGPEGTVRNEDGTVGSNRYGEVARTRGPAGGPVPEMDETPPDTEETQPENVISGVMTDLVKSMMTAPPRRAPTPPPPRPPRRGFQSITLVDKDK